MREVTLEFLLRFFRLSSVGGVARYDFWWRTDGEYAPVTLFINCNDLFAWGCADCEEVTPENIHVLEETARDLKALPSGKEENYKRFATELFAARVRGERPQGACYKNYPPEVAALFDAAGPEREVDFFNPKPRIDKGG